MPPRSITHQCAKCAAPHDTLMASIECYMAHEDISDPHDPRPGWTREKWFGSPEFEDLTDPQDNAVNLNALLAVVLQEGAAMPLYFTGPCGRRWASIAGLKPITLWRIATMGTEWAGLPYKPSRYCSSIFHGVDDEYSTEIARAALAQQEEK